MAVAWGYQLLFDIIIFVLTMWKSCCIGRLGHHSLIDILLRDGQYSLVDSCLARRILMYPVHRFNVFCVSGHLFPLVFRKSDCYRILSAGNVANMITLLVSRHVFLLNGDLKHSLRS